MEGSILKKLSVYPANEKLSGLTESPNYTQKNLMNADISVFHESPIVEDDLAEDALEPSYDDGFRDGQAKSDLVYQNTISVMQSALDTLQVELSEIVKHIEVDHLMAVTDCLKSTMPELMKVGAGLEIKNLIAETSEAALSGTVTFTVHPDAAESCRRLCELQSADFNVVVDPSLSPSQARVSWESGGAEINCAEIFQTFLQKFEAVLEDLNLNNKAEQNNG